MSDDGTSFNPPAKAKGSAFLKKRVMGVPVLYLAGAFVMVLAFYAFKVKSSPGPSTAGAEAELGDLSGSGGPIGGEVYPNMPQGTVIVAPAPPSGIGVNSAITDNDAWLKAGVGNLLGNGSGGGTAQQALQAYLNGDNLSYDQGVLRDRIIKEYGLPPNPPFAGNTSPKDLPPVPPVPTPPAPVIPVTPLPVAPPVVAYVDPARTSIINAYQSGLGRAPGESEITAWLSRPGDDASGIYGSQEAIQRRDRETIVNAYQSSLGRAPGEPEITAWLKRAGDDAAGIAGSPEAVKRRGKR